MLGSRQNGSLVIGRLGMEGHSPKRSGATADLLLAGRGYEVAAGDEPLVEL